MESVEEIKKIIGEAKNIYLIPNENEPEAMTCALALFYTLKELDKNVNLVTDNFPEKLNFLLPSLDAISTPKNFVISVPRSAANVSQIYYEKTDESLKIHLTVDKGKLKKENISFYFQEVRPDLIFTLGVQDFKSQLETTLDSFGFLLGVPIINIDNNKENTKFGQINLLGEKSLSETVIETIKSIDENMVGKSVANCLLAGLITYYENFRNADAGEKVFLTAGELIKRGANNQQIVDNLYKTGEQEMKDLGQIFLNLRKEGDLLFSLVSSSDFEGVTSGETRSLVEKVRNLGVENDLLVLWQSHNSDPVVQGFFYSNNQVSIDKVAKACSAISKNDWVFLRFPGDNINLIKDNIIKVL